MLQIPLVVLADEPMLSCYQFIGVECRPVRGRATFPWIGVYLKDDFSRGYVSISSSNAMKIMERLKEEVAKLTA